MKYELLNLYLWLVQHRIIGILLLTFLFGCVGSVLNMMIYRIPRMLHEDQGANSINLFWPRSFCPTCQRTIPAYYNIPILSYCLLRGRCAQCQNAIPPHYLWVEIACIALSWLTLWHLGVTIALIFALMFIWILIILCVIDLKHQLLPDTLTLSLLWLGLIANTIPLWTPLNEAVLSTVAAYVSLWLLIQCYYLCTKKVGMGHGDFKLFAAFGAWFGWQGLPMILFIASLLGVICGGIYLKVSRQSHQTPIPFGPFLCFSGIMWLFFKF